MAERIEPIAYGFASLMAIIQDNVPEARGGAVGVYTQDELFTHGAELGFPLVGIVYVGMRPLQPGSNRTAASTQQADMFFELYVVGEAEALGDEGAKYLDATDLLDILRNEILLTSATSGRRWRLVSERPAEMAGRIGYVQTWALQVALMPRQRDPGQNV